MQPHGNGGVHHQDAFGDIGQSQRLAPRNSVAAAEQRAIEVGQDRLRKAAPRAHVAAELDLDIDALAHVVDELVVEGVEKKPRRGSYDDSAPEIALLLDQRIIKRRVFEHLGEMAIENRVHQRFKKTPNLRSKRHRFVVDLEHIERKLVGRT